MDHTLFQKRHKYSEKYKISLEEAQSGDLFILNSKTTHPSRYFIVDGWATSNTLAIRFLKDLKAVPRGQNHKTYYHKNGKMIYWVDDLLNHYPDGFEDKITLLNPKDRISMAQDYDVTAFVKNKIFENKIYRIFNAYSPVTMIGLTLLMVLLITLYRYLSGFKILRTTFQTKLLVFVIFISIVMIIFSPFILIFDSFMTIRNINNSFIIIPSLFITYLFVFVLYHYFSNKIAIDNFFQQQINTVSLLLILGMSCEFLVKTVMGDILGESHLNNINLWISPFSMWLWIIFVIANFLSNLSVYLYSVRRKSRLLQSSKDEAQKSMELLRTAQTRINHHFLYNSLHALSAIASTQPVKTEKMALSLAAYYRYCTNREDKKWSTISDEISAVTAYFEVQSIRYSDKLSYHIEVPDYIENEKIPRFLLLHLVEYAMKNGFNPITSRIYVRLEILKKDAVLDIKVFDSGVPYDEVLISVEETEQIKKLLKEFYMDKFAITFYNEPQKHIDITLNTDHP
jgi:sensor histidine kinase YesM